MLRTKRHAFPSASNPPTIDVQPGMPHLAGARLKRGPLDIEGIPDNAYREPVVRDVRPGTCD